MPKVIPEVGDMLVARGGRYRVKEVQAYGVLATDGNGERHWFAFAKLRWDDEALLFRHQLD